MTRAKDDRQLDKRPILPSGRHLPTSCYYSSFSCFLLMILPCAFLSREALSQPPSSRSRWIHLLLDFRFAKQAFLSLSARRRGFFSIFSVFCGLKFRALSYYYRSFSCFFAKIFLNGHELSHDILCISRSDDNRRTAGAVDFSVFRVHYV